MKKSTIKTEYILVKAYTCSEWDTCDFAILKIDKNWEEQIQKRLKLAHFIEDMNDFVSVVFQDNAVDFYCLDKEDNPNFENILGEHLWQFVSLEDNQQYYFEVPQSTLNLRRMTLCKGGNAYFQAFGKHTGEEFYTDDINLNQLIEKL